MPYEVEDSQIPLHDENRFYYGVIKSIAEETGNYGTQLKWALVLDGDENAWTDDEGNQQDRETWTWCSAKLTTNEKNKFRKYVKGLLGREPEKGELIDEQKFVGMRVGVMFEQYTKNDGTKGEKIILMAAEDQVR